MNPAQLIARVHSAGARIEARGGTLKLSGPRPLPDDLMSALRESKADLLAHLIGERYAVTVSDLRQAAGPDWPEAEANPVLLETVAKAVLIRRMRERGEMPSHYAARTVCTHCGPVPIFEGAPTNVGACPWCFNRKAGKPIPTGDMT